MIAPLLHGLAACYLIVTLTATSLAKLRRWRASSLAMIREQVIPAAIAPLVVIGTSLVELALATLLMLGVKPLLVSCAIAVTFGLFGIYRLLVAARTKSLTCACAGSPRYSPATPRAVAATVVTTLFQVGVAVAVMVTASQSDAGVVKLAAAVAWLAPLAAIVAGRLVRPLPKGGGRDLAGVEPGGHGQPSDQMTPPSRVALDEGSGSLV